jgi:hypothetical protein
VRDGDGLVLELGVLGRTNGVALLAEHGFDEGVQRKAEEVATWLAQRRHDDAGMDVRTVDGSPSTRPTLIGTAAT